MKKILWGMILFIALFAQSSCKKDVQKSNKTAPFSFPCYHLSVTKPVAYIQGSDTVIYTYDSLNRLTSAFKLNTNSGNKYFNKSNTNINMNTLPLGGNTYLPYQYQFLLTSTGAISYYDNEISNFSAQAYYSNGLLDSILWYYPTEESHSYNGAFDSAVYDADNNLISINTSYVNVQTHNTYIGSGQINMTYYPDKIYKPFDPEQELMAISSSDTIDPQVFSKYLLASISNSHYYTYTLNSAGMVKMISDSTPTSVIKRYIYYDCE